MDRKEYRTANMSIDGSCVSVLVLKTLFAILFQVNHETSIEPSETSACSVLNLKQW